MVSGAHCPFSLGNCHLLNSDTAHSTANFFAVYCAICHFRHFLEAREFHVLTDHKRITHSLHSKPDKHSPRQVRHLDFISQFTSDIRHVAGQGNPVADALSRMETNAVTLLDSPPTVDFQAMAKAQPDITEL